MRRSTSARSRGAALAHPGWASAAASAAARASSVPAAATSATSSSVAGSVTANRSPLDAARQRPPMKRSVRRSSFTDRL